MNEIPIESKIMKAFIDGGRTFALAESCTGGSISQRITNVAGSSKYFRGGIVAYSNAVKTDILGVSTELIEEHGAVSPDVAEAMAQGALRLMGVDIAASITGIAGPGGATPDKPVGLAYMAVCSEKASIVHKILVDGTREEIKEKFSDEVLKEVKEFLAS